MDRLEKLVHSFHGLDSRPPKQLFGSRHRYLKHFPSEAISAV
jgi:hypothetical protein